ncbi:tellurite resistance protein [Psychromonas aquimarina]|uniref:tellurite resistance protein n=1 Tax=Psychromonas aquimarina TaxID=444919 RepID=UPI00040248C3|nr:tellurite resistance protein [Psychromonas aquimarina]
MSASALLKQHLSLLKQSGKPVLDLACGSGRNGLYLLEHNIPTIFADKNRQALETIAALPLTPAPHCRVVDFETDQQHLQADSYQAVIVFRYLHRPLMEQIKQAVCSGGIVIYETFTLENRQFGRPNREQFLLRPGELKQLFSGWQCLHYFEGIKTNPDRAIAQIVCRKP